MCVIDNLRLRESVGIILHDHGVEFFKTNIRESLSLKMNFPDIVNLLKRFDGKTSVKQIAKDYGSIDVQQLATLAKHLKEQSEYDKIKTFKCAEITMATDSHLWLVKFRLGGSPTKVKP